MELSELSLCRSGSRGAKDALLALAIVVASPAGWLDHKPKISVVSGGSRTPGLATLVVLSHPWFWLLGDLKSQTVFGPSIDGLLSGWMGC